MKRFKKLISYTLYTLLVAVLFTSCAKTKNGVIVKDKHGNYYKLNGDDALGVERYLLEKIDTTKVKPVGFNCN